ncbi:MAG: hypothetical protein JNL74_18530 [Fibrobacteres bacterium]|nr:hypothetical protein [Fibrobacterota bacterium]
MTRTTILLHESVLKKAKQRVHETHKTLGETITELLSIGLETTEKANPKRKTHFVLPEFKMGIPKINLTDKDALFKVLEKGYNK